MLSAIGEVLKPLFAWQFGDLFSPQRGEIEVMGLRSLGQRSKIEPQDDVDFSVEVVPPSQKGRRPVRHLFISEGMLERLLAAGECGHEEDQQYREELLRGFRDIVAGPIKSNKMFVVFLVHKSDEKYMEKLLEIAKLFNQARLLPRVIFVTLKPGLRGQVVALAKQFKLRKLVVYEYQDRPEWVKQCV